MRRYVCFFYLQLDICMLQTVVESEPNPIRDTHEPGATLLHYSPSSGSPDEDEASAAATQRAQDDETTTPGNDADTTPFDLSMIRAETPVG